MRGIRSEARRRYANPRTLRTVKISKNLNLRSGKWSAAGLSLFAFPKAELGGLGRANSRAGGVGFEVRTHEPEDAPCVLEATLQPLLERLAARSEDADEIGRLDAVAKKDEVCPASSEYLGSMRRIADRTEFPAGEYRRA